MIDNTINTATDSGDLTPITPPTVSNPPIPPLVPLGTWTWNTPVIPTFYWNVYSAEQRIRQICLELGRIGAWCDYATSTANLAHMELSNRIDELAAKLTEEVTRLDLRIDEENKAREAADALLQEGLDAETARAKAAEQVLQQNLDTETANRESADETLNKKIADETERANNAEILLETNLNTEIKNRQSSDNELREQIDYENERAVNAETVLQSHIDNEEAERESADNELESTIRANKVSADESDKRIQDSLDTEIANRKNADTTLGERIENESNTRKTADENLNSAISAEAANRQTADNLLTQQINRRVKATNIISAADSHITVSSTVSDTDPDKTVVTIGDTFAGDFKRLDTAIYEETVRATAAENTLDGRITHETTDRETADNLLTQAVNERLKASGVIAGDNITVSVDPDSTTVTINSTSTGFTGVTTDATLSGNGTTDTPLMVNTDNIATTEQLRETNLTVADEINSRTIADSEIQREVGRKLEASNVKAGDNITVTTDGNDVTITSTSSGGLQTVSVNSPLYGNGTSESPIAISESDFDSLLQDNETIRSLQSVDSSLMSRTSTLESIMPTKLAAVAHDDTLTGSGSSADLLGVRLNHTTVMSDTGNTVYPTLMHASGDETTINGIGFNVGDGLTAYNSSDADTGSGLRLSDSTLDTLSAALTYVAVNSEYLDGVGMSGAELTLSSALKQHVKRLYVNHYYMQPVKIEFTVEQLSDSNYDLARKFSAAGITRSNLFDLTKTAPEYGAQLGVLDLHDDAGAAVEPGDYKYVRIKFNDVNDDMQTYLNNASTTNLTFTPITGTGTTYSIRMQTPYLHKAADGYEAIYAIASTGTSNSIPVGTYTVTWYKAS